MGNVLEVGEENFEAQVLKAELPVVADFSADWCMPCVKLSPILEELAADYAGKVVIAHIDVDKAFSLARQYRVMSVPTLLFFKGGKIVDTSIGLAPKAQLAERIDAMLP
jgi:thioredoxin 1